MNANFRRGRSKCADRPKYQRGTSSGSVKPLVAGPLLTCLFICTSWAGAAEFQRVAIHPDAALQETVTGRTLHTLHIHDGNVFMGYGDYSADTGPINVRYFDTQAEEVSASQITVLTESIARFETVGNALFALTTDPLLREPGGYVVLNDHSNEWVEEYGLSGLHFFDIAPFGDDPQHVLLAGSGGPNEISESFVYESTDGGATWRESLVLNRPLTSDETDFTRFYGIGSLNGNAYVQHVLYNPWEALPIYVYDGNTWTQGPLLRTDSGQMTKFIDPLTFAGEIVIRNEHSGVGLSPLFRFDGQSLSALKIEGVAVNSWDQFVFGDRLYVLTERNGIIASDDLVSWSTIISNVPGIGRSLALVERDIYLGATNGELYKSQLDSVWHNFENPSDVDSLDGVAPLDALLVINELSDRIVSDPTTGLLPLVGGLPPYLDVDNDWVVSPVDALLVINQLPSTSVALFAERIGKRIDVVEPLAVPEPGGAMQPLMAALFFFARRHQGTHR